MTVGIESGPTLSFLQGDEMVSQMPTQREILKWNRKLPDNLQQCSVVLQFKKPMPKYLTENFYLVRMTQGMLSAGEEEMWIPEITQKELFDKQKCLGCGRIMKRVGSLSTVCLNRVCNSAGRVVIQTLKRAVHSIKTEFDIYDKNISKMITVSFLVGRDWESVNTEIWWNMGYAVLQEKGFIHGVVTSDDEIDQVRDAIKTYLRWPEAKIPIDMVTGCLVVLDRRYSEECLCAVYRTAGILCDQMGWGLK